VVPGIARRLDQLVDDVLRGGLVGIPHPEVDHVLAPGPGLGLEVVDNREDVGGETLDPVELVHGNLAGKSYSCRAKTVNKSGGWRETRRQIAGQGAFQD
jgi:hypothetical protein